MDNLQKLIGKVKLKRTDDNVKMILYFLWVCSILAAKSLLIATKQELEIDDYRIDFKTTNYQLLAPSLHKSSIILKIVFQCFQTFLACRWYQKTIYEPLTVDSSYQIRKSLLFAKLLFSTT